MTKSTPPPNESKRGGRRWCFTLNNPTPEEDAACQAWQCVHLIFGREVGAEGTAHLQGAVSFADAKSLSAVRRLAPRAHWEAMRGTPAQAAMYCQKDGDVFEKGVRPLSPSEKGEKERSRWRSAFDAVAEGRLDDVDPELLCRHLKGIEYAVQRTALGKRGAATLDGDMPHRWIVGQAGTGKTTFARTEYPEHYLKDPATKWWDHYAGQETVIIEDVDKSQASMAGMYRRWIDRWAFAAETKGGGLTIRPPRIVVTSQFLPEEIWTCPRMQEAIARRVTVTSLDAADEVDEPGPEWSEHVEAI